MKRISLEELLKSFHTDSYEKQYLHVMELLDRGKIKPVKAAGTNGKHPALHCAYWLVEQKKDYSVWEEELKYKLHPMISVDYYLSHLENYEKDREFVLLLDCFLKNHQELLQYPESVNERSFEIWQREKFLAKDQGKRILKNCSIQMEQLNVYGTAEPLAYYSRTRTIPQNMLILENKDTFYSMRQHLLAGKEHIFNTKTGTLIYGAGKRILKSFGDFNFCVEPYMAHPENTLYYFGDLDYEGIGIYENFASAFQEHWNIIPFVPAYEKMLMKAEKVPSLPKMKEGQNKNISGFFFSHFSDGQAEKMKEILNCGEYIPQEILNLADFSAKPGTE